MRISRSVEFRRPLLFCYFFLFAHNASLSLLGSNSIYSGRLSNGIWGNRTEGSQFDVINVDVSTIVLLLMEIKEGKDEQGNRSSTKKGDKLWTRKRPFRCGTLELGRPSARHAVFSAKKRNHSQRCYEEESKRRADYGKLEMFCHRKKIVLEKKVENSNLKLNHHRLVWVCAWDNMRFRWVWKIIFSASLLASFSNWLIIFHLLFLAHHLPSRTECVSVSTSNELQEKHVMSRWAEISISLSNSSSKVTDTITFPF